MPPFASSTPVSEAAEVSVPGNPPQTNVFTQPHTIDSTGTNVLLLGVGPTRLEHHPVHQRAVGWTPVRTHAQLEGATAASAFRGPQICSSLPPPSLKSIKDPDWVWLDVVPRSEESLQWGHMQVWSQPVGRSLSCGCFSPSLPPLLPL